MLCSASVTTNIYLKIHFSDSFLPWTLSTILTLSTASRMLFGVFSVRPRAQLRNVTFVTYVCVMNVKKFILKKNTKRCHSDGNVLTALKKPSPFVCVSMFCFCFLSFYTCCKCQEKNWYTIITWNEWKKITPQTTVILQRFLQLLIYSFVLCQRYISMQKNMAKLDSLEDKYFTQWIHLVPSSLPQTCRSLVKTMDHHRYKHGV